MLDLPEYIYFIFYIATILTLYFFYVASNRNIKVIVVSVLWLILTGVLGYFGFYENTNVTPPRFIFLPIPAFIFIAFLLFTKWGKEFTDSLNLEWLTILQSVRILVEIVIFGWFVYQLVPKLMTFEGRNFDILAGLTSPIVWFLYFNKKSIGKRGLLIWNVVCLCLVINIVVNAVLSAEGPFQQFAFEQPNRAVLYFPFVWLPGFIVPVVIYSHIASIRKLVRG